MGSGTLSRWFEMKSFILEQKPNGAVREGEHVMLSLRVLRTRYPHVTLMVNDVCFPLQWLDFHGGYDQYVAVIDTTDRRGLFWYSFEADGKSLGGEIQLTVYAKDYQTPAWYAQGVTYHVFVDRFYRGDGVSPDRNDPDYFVHERIDEPPHYKPDAEGEIRNCDIYGGTLRGVQDKLPYLESLGVTTIYLSPIFEAWSSHKYNTADYQKVDPHFGTRDDLIALCSEARRRGIRVILDGAFSHTGSDSIYFNANGRYPSMGAAQSEDSPYREWYTFHDGGYDAWWGIRTLPATRELTPSYLDFIIESENSVVAQWMQTGISGWRLDVADELPDEFILRFRRRVKTLDPDAIVIGEVWEDASNKIAYGVRRKYFTDNELDGVMNYPLKEGILGFLSGRVSGVALAEQLTMLLEHYPAPTHHCLMNLIGTHDTPRALTVLACPQYLGAMRDFKATYRLNDEERERGRALLKLAVCLQYAFPGSPSLYYGDEAGVSGFEDPFNRTCYPWGNEDTELIEFYRKLGAIKRGQRSLHTAPCTFPFAGETVLVLARGALWCVINRGDTPQKILLPGWYRDLLQKNWRKRSVTVPPHGFLWLKRADFSLPTAGYAV